MKCKPCIRHFQPPKFRCFSSQCALHGLCALEKSSQFGVTKKNLCCPESVSYFAPKAATTVMTQHEIPIPTRNKTTICVRLCQWWCHQECLFVKGLGNIKLTIGSMLAGENPEKQHGTYILVTLTLLFTQETPEQGFLGFRKSSPASRFTVAFLRKPTFGVTF